MKTGKTILITKEAHAELKRRVAVEKARRKYNVTYAILINELLRK